jgi:2,5-dioxopentanoate dehydrogenase
MIEAGQIIDGVLSRQNDKQPFNGVNPATNESLAPQFFDATTAEINTAIDLAQQAFVVYRKTTDAKRAEFLEQIAVNIEALGDDLLNKASEETGLPLARLTGERGRTAGQLRLFAQKIKDGTWRNNIHDEALPDRQPLPRQDIRQTQIPLGPVGVFGASNFPLAFSVAGGDTAAALAAGCPVIFKGHPAHPATCQLVGMAIANAASTCGLPKGVFALLHGVANEVGSQIVTHPLIKAVAFTGSFRGGKALFDLANKRPEPIPVYAEMGSINPVFFLPHAIKKDGEAIAKNFAASVTMGAGQFCTNPGFFVLVDNEEGKKFVQQLQEAVAATSVHAMLTPGICNAYKNGVKELKAALGDASVDADNGNVGTAHVFTTTLAGLKQHKALTEEVFGPSTVGVLVKDETEMQEIIGLLQGQITGTVHAQAEDEALANAIIEALMYKVGRVLVNGFPTGVEVCHAMVHGGPFPATTDSRSTSVGTQAMYRFTRPVCLQNFTANLLPTFIK